MSLSRRDFIKQIAAMSALAALGVPGKARASDGMDTWVKAVCRYCGTGCGVMVGVKDGKVVTVKGDPNNHNKGLLCLKGALLAPVIYAKDRITEPLIRRNGKLEPASWDEALDLTARKFKESIAAHGPESVGYYGSGQALTEETYLASKIFKAGLKSNNVEGNPRLCMASAVGGYVTTFGKDEPCGSFDDFDTTSCFFIFGSNTSECHPVLFRRIAARKQADKNVKVIVVDPRTTNTARIADLYLKVKAGNDLALLNAMAYVIFREELDDPRFISRYVTIRSNDKKKRTREEYLEFLEDYAPEKVADLVGVSAEDIWKAGRMFGEAPASLSLWCMGANQRTRGVWANNLISNLHLITGKIGKPGSSPFSLTGQPNACGGVRDTGGLSHLLPAGRVIAKKEHRNQVEKQWGIPQDSLNPKPGLHTTALFDAMSKGNVNCLLTLCTNPAHSLPNLHKFNSGMKKCFMVCIEAFGDAKTLEFADVVLPPAFWVEREGVYGCSERRYALISKAIEPPGQCRASVNILVDLALRMGVDPKIVPFKNAEDVWNEWRNVSAATPYNFKGITRERLRKESGILWPCPTEDHPGTKIRYVRGQDPNIPEDHPNKYWFYGKPDGRAVVWMRPQKPPAEPADEQYPFVLTTGRVIDHWHTATMTGKVPEISKSFPEAYVEVNDKDAEQFGIKNGDTVELITRRGSMTFPARVGDVCNQGLVFVPWFDPNKLVNELTIDAIDPGSKQPEFKICACKIRKV